MFLKKIFTPYTSIKIWIYPKKAKNSKKSKIYYWQPKKSMLLLRCIKARKELKAMIKGIVLKGSLSSIIEQWKELQKKYKYVREVK